MSHINVNNVEEIFSLYNSSKSKERKEYEIEIRYTSKVIETSLIVKLLSIIYTKYNIKEEKIADHIINISNTSKKVLRTYFDTKIEKYYRKDSIVRINRENSIGSYTINLSKEIEIEEKDIPEDANIINLKKRFSYILPNYNDWRVDITIIRSSEPQSQSIVLVHNEFFNQINTFEELISSINKRPHIYNFNIEIEYIGNKNIPLSLDMHKLAIQPFLLIDPIIESKILFHQEVLKISKIIDNTIGGTSNIQNLKKESLKLKDILPPVKILTKQLYNEIYPPINYLLKEKADGERKVININNNKIFIVSDPNKIEIYDIPKYDNKLTVDTEFIKDKNIFIIFDVIQIDSEILQIDIQQRILFIDKCSDILNKHLPKYKFISAKYHSLSNPMKYKTLFEETLNFNDYEIDGLILVKTGNKYFHTVTYKWKPAEKQTIDVLCKKCPNDSINSYFQKRDHDLYFLYVTCSTEMKKNIKILPNIGYNLLFKTNINNTIIPIQFSTPFVPLGYIYYHPISSKIDIKDKIVEFSLDVNEPTIYERGKFFFNWKVVKIRDDREYIEGKYYGNYYTTAFFTIINCINILDKNYLYKGSSDDQYFQNTGGERNIYSPLRLLSNYIKQNLIGENAHQANSVMDIASGRGGDLDKYIQRNSVKNLLVTDVDKFSLAELFSRWIGLVRKIDTTLQTVLRGVVMNINDNATQNIKIIKSITETSYFNAIFCFTALHYFTESINSIRNFALFCKELSIVDTKLVITCLCGESVFNKLKDTNSWILREDEVIKYRIDKLYTENVKTEAGQKISLLLPFSKGKMYEEYLVNTTVFINTMKEFNFKLVYKKSYSDFLEGFSVNRQKVFRQLTKVDKLWNSMYITMVFKRI